MNERPEQNPTATTFASRGRAIPASTLSPDERAALTRRSDARGLWAIASTWLIIAASLALVALWPHPLTVIAAMALIAGRQLALAILQHEGAHGTLFRTRWMNDLLTDWLCARPLWQNLHKYRAHHARHHTRTGTEDDPDISLHAGYPATRRSMLRKALRDISGLTGLKVLFGYVLMDAGVIRWTVASDIERLPQQGRRWWSYPHDFLRNAAGMLQTNLALFAVLWASGHPWLYLLWVGAYLTPFPLFVRIRSIAEHGMLPRAADIAANTRTTSAGWLERLFVAPMRVNYHFEHHAMASVPYYHLPQLHRLLRSRGVVDEPPRYVEVMRLAASRRPDAA